MKNTLDLEEKYNINWRTGTAYFGLINFFRFENSHSLQGLKLKSDYVRGPSAPVDMIKIDKICNVTFVTRI